MWKEKYDEWLKRPKCESFFLGGEGGFLGASVQKRGDRLPKWHRDAIFE